MKNWAIIGFCSALAMSSAMAAAETMPVSGIYPANVDLPGDVEVIAVEPFGGDAGADVEIALTQMLGEVRIEGRPWFRIAPPPGYGQSGTVTILDHEGQPVSVGDPNAPDAILRGSVRSEVLERRIEPRVVEECVERDAEDKCIRREKRRIPCWEMSLRFDPRIMLMSINGRQLYANNTPQIETARYCRDDNAVPSTLDMANRMIDRIALEVRGDLAPVARSNGYRVMERRKGLKGEAREAFKQAVKLTEVDQGAACNTFMELMNTNPDHVSVIFNVGLCSESFGYLDEAEQYYRTALGINPKTDYAADGLRRLHDRERAAMQIEARDGRDGQVEDLP